MGAVSILKTLLESVKPKKAPVPPRYQEKLKLDGKVAVKAVANEKELTLKLPLETIKNASREQLVELIGSAMSKATA